MNDPEMAAMRDVEVSVWAANAKCCPVCKADWDKDAVLARDPKVACVEPRILVCADPCWKKWLEICEENAENAKRLS